MRIALLAVWIAACAGTARAQEAVRPADADMLAARQAVGLFSQFCLRFMGDPVRIRDMLRGKNVPELKPEARAIFLRDRTGVGFDASNRAARLAIVSQDSGLCDVFLADKGERNVVPLLEQSLRQGGFTLTKKGEEDRGAMHAVSYGIALGSRPFTIVASVNPNPSGSVRAILTLATQAR